MVYRSISLFLLLFFLTVQTSFATPVPAMKPTENEKVVVQNNTAQSNILTHKKISYEKPLNKREIELYREIFALQSEAKWLDANKLIEKIDNTILLGHVTIHRLLHKNYKTKKDEYKHWISQFPDHPQSKHIDKILGTNQSQYKVITKGALSELQFFAKGSRYISDNYKSGEQYELDLVKAEVAKYLENGSVTQGLEFFNSHRVQKYIDPIDKAQILAEIAAYYLYLNKRDEAKSIALAALKSSKQAPLAGWVAGLTAWINDDMVSATKYFTIASKAQYASPWMTAAASYWGARAATRAKLYKEVSPLLAKAVQNQRTFYGLIATKALGYGYDFNWTMPDYTPKHKDRLFIQPAGARAVSLAEIGQLKQAEEELFAVKIDDDILTSEALIAFAHHYNLAGYAMQFASSRKNPAGGYYDAGLFPISGWTSHLDEKDIPLVNAFIRQESAFRATAYNETGATGLMQIMPQTAAFISGDKDFEDAANKRLLNNPETNIRLGKDYLNHLLDIAAVDNDMFGLTIAYNSGPGKLTRWKNDLEIDDPLLFIELIPSSETRGFVERVLTNYWVYQMQMNIEPTTLTAVASGDWPKLD